MKKQYITDKMGKKKAIVLSMKAYEKLIDKIEEMEDIQLAEKARKHGGKAIPFEKVMKDLNIKLHAHI